MGRCGPLNMRRASRAAIAVAAIGVGAVGCASPNSEPVAQAHDGHLEIAGARWEVPANWQRTEDAPRIWAAYRRPPVGSDVFPAELTVHYRPGDGGGSVEATLRHWVGQMNAPGGGDAQRVALRSRWNSGNLVFDFIEVSGIYQRSMGGGPMTGGRTKAEAGYRLFGAVVTGPEGRAFLRAVGPESTVRRTEEEFRAMIGLPGARGADPPPAG